MELAAALTILEPACNPRTHSSVVHDGGGFRSDGGQLTTQPFEIEHVGTLVMFKDTEGNTVGAMQYLPGIR